MRTRFNKVYTLSTSNSASSNLELLIAGRADDISKLALDSSSNFTGESAAALKKDLHQFGKRASDRSGQQSGRKAERAGTSANLKSKLSKLGD